MAAEKYVVLDTCVWIALVQKVGLSAGLEALAAAVGDGNLRLIVPEVVRMELLKPGKDIESAEGIRKSLVNAGKAVRAGSKDYTPESLEAIEDAINGLNTNLDQWIMGIPERMNKVRELLDHPDTVTIPITDSARSKAATMGMNKQAPFHKGKNSTADALILAGVHEWAEQNPSAEVSFHTLNCNDFSSEQIKQNPHPDLAPLFEGNFSYSYGTKNLLQLVTTECELLEEASRIDFGGPGYCDICDNKTLIEGASCSKCGEYTHDVPENEDYSIQDGEGGQKMLVRPNPGGSSWEPEEEALKCPKCHNETFDIEYASMCSYHEYSFERD